MVYPRPALRQRTLRSLLREAVETLVLIATIYALVNLASARFIVEGDSMQPNFATGQFLIVSRVNYLLGKPERGDIVVFHYPLEPETDYLKRVIGLPGEVVEIMDTHVYINGVQLNEPYIHEACTPTICPNRRWEIGPSQYFVMGDNRNHSSDSRSFDAVDQRFIVGEALLRYWPPDEWGIVTKIHFPGDIVPE
jgi:signal peptidase I